MTQVTAAPAGGLSSAEAADRLAGYGPNELPRARATPWWRLVADQVRDPLILVLLVAAVLTVATGDLADASVIVLVIVVNTTVGVVQEIKAGQAIAAYLLPGAVLVHDNKHRWRIFPDRVAALGGTGRDTAGPVNRQ
jgi:Ca2+-transporting ATPase